MFTKQQIRRLEELLGVKNKPSSIEENYREKAIYYIQFLQWIPGIRMVGLGNSLAMKSANQDSDIDLFIVTAKNRMWMVRILVTIVFTVCRERKTDTQHAGKFCLSFFCTQEALDFSSFAIERDIYLYYWIYTCLPILDYNETYQNFLDQNSWGKTDYVFEEKKSYIRYKKQTLYSHTRLGNTIEKLCKCLCIGRSLQKFHDLGRPYGIMITDKMLKFHNHDQRKILREKVYTESTGKIGKDL